MKTVRFSDVELATQCFGEPTNPAILLIMGAMCTMVWWEEPFCQLLARKGFFVIRYDNRDTGLSTCYPPGQPGYSFEELAEDAMRVLDAYGIQRAFLMGMSMGGMLTQMLALRHPERVLGIVLLSTMYFAEGCENLPYSSDEVNAFFEELAKNPPGPTVAQRVEAGVRQWKTTAQGLRTRSEAELRALCQQEVERSPHYESRMNHAVAEVTGDELTRIATLNVPTLVLHGTQDAVIPFPHGQWLAKTIPGAVLHPLEGTGHVLHPEDYEAVCGWIVERFVEQM